MPEGATPGRGRVSKFVLYILCHLFVVFNLPILTLWFFWDQELSVDWKSASWENESRNYIKKYKKYQNHELGSEDSELGGSTLYENV